MIRIMIAASVLALGLGTAAHAQSSEANSGSKTIPDSTATTNSVDGTSDTWLGSMGPMFFTDAEGMTLRSEDEIRTNYGSLTDEQKAAMRDECGAFTGESGSAGNDGNRPNAAPMSALCDMTGAM